VGVKPGFFRLIKFSGFGVSLALETMSDDEATSNVIEVVMPTYIMRPDADEK